MRSLMICTVHQILFGDQEMGGGGACIQGVAGGDVRERAHLEDPGIVGRKILKWICSKWDRDMG
jgi:hypothetical protein